MEDQLIKDFLQNRPVDPVKIRSAINDLITENQKLKNAILTGSENKRRYSGQITETIHDEAVCACGHNLIFHHDRILPWSTIRDVLSLVQKTAKS